MTFNLIGLGLTVNSITQEAKAVLDTCETIYLESYTVNFPYTVEELETTLGKKITILKREQTEDESILSEAKKTNIALLVYGDALSATTHTQLILSCKKQNIPYKIFHNASILIAIARTGLQLYKFGKIPSMPKWQKNYEPTSFLEYYKENKSINAHTLVLTDISLTLPEALTQLESACTKESCTIEKLIVISHAGLPTQKIFFDQIKNLKQKDIPMPFCLIIPGELHFHEQEALENFKEQ